MPPSRLLIILALLFGLTLPLLALGLPKAATGDPL